MRPAAVRCPRCHRPLDAVLEIETGDTIADGTQVEVKILNLSTICSAVGRHLANDCLADGGNEPTTCPRRMNEPGGWRQQEGLDEWGQDGDVRRCTFCHSLHPDDFLDQLADGVTYTPGTSATQAKIGDATFLYQHMDSEQMARFMDIMDSGKIVFGYPGYMPRRPFFMEAGGPAPGTG